MMKYIINILFFLIVSASYAQAFDSEKNNSQILNAADIPVEYSTGVPDIGIDLFNVPTINPNFNLNLKLQYDLYSNSSALFSTNQIGDFWRIGILSKISRKSKSNGSISAALLTDEEFYENASNIETRSDKDIFTYDAFGNTGKFYLKRDGNTFKVEVIEQNDFANITVSIAFVSNIENALKYKINSFTITDKNGNQYFYSTPDYKIFTTKPSEKYPIDFHLTTIKDKYNTLLTTYTYVETPKAFTRPSSGPKHTLYTNKIKQINVNKIAIIDFELTNFNSNTIVLKDLKNVIHKNVKFSFFGWNVSCSNGTWSKKALHSMAIFSNDSSKSQTYKFEYNYRTLVNPYLTDLGLIRRFDSCNSISHAYKDYLYYDHNVLKKIVYPTGGCVYYDFEPNDYSLFRYNLGSNLDQYPLDVLRKNNSANFSFQDLPMVHDPLNSRYLVNPNNIPNTDNLIFFNYDGQYYPNPNGTLGGTVGIVDENGNLGGPSNTILPKLKIYEYRINSNYDINNSLLVKTLSSKDKDCEYGHKIQFFNALYSLNYDLNQLNSYTSITAKIQTYKPDNEIQNLLYANGLRVKRIVSFDTDVTMTRYNNNNYTTVPASEIIFDYKKFDDPNVSSGDTKYALMYNDSHFSNNFENYSDLINYKNVSVKTSNVGETQYTFDDPNATLNEDTSNFPARSFVKKLPTKIVKKDVNGNTIEENTFQRIFKEFNTNTNGVNKQPIITYEKVTNRSFINGSNVPLELSTESRFDTISRNLDSKKIINQALGETFEEAYTFVKYNGAYLPKTVTKFKNGFPLNKSENNYTPINVREGLNRYTYYNLSNTMVAKADLPLEIEKEITLTAATGQIREYKTKEGTYVSQIWGYNGAYLIAELHNFRYSSIDTTILNNLVAESNKTDTTYNEETIRTIANQLRSTYPQSHIKSYTYNPLIGITSTTDANGTTEKYIYDTFNNLYRIINNEGLIVKEYFYNYKNQ